MFSRIVTTPNYFSAQWCDNINQQIIDNIQPDPVFGKKGVRRCTVRLLHQHTHQYNQVFASMMGYVKNNYKQLNVDIDFNIDGPIQHISYHPGDYVGWHDDTMTIKDAMSNSKFSNLKTNRKLSMLVMLSDHSTYTGGQFVFDPKYSPQPDIQQQGTTALFTSFSQHKVEEIQSGVRNILFMFLTGPEWK